jgi:methyl-accepting chemotaxis protein
VPTKKSGSLLRGLVTISLTIVAVALVVILGAAGLYNDRKAVRTLTERADLSLDVLKATFGILIETGSSTFLQARVVGLRYDQDFAAITVVDPSGRLLASSARDGATPIPASDVLRAFAVGSPRPLSDVSYTSGETYFTGRALYGQVMDQPPKGYALAAFSLVAAKAHANDELMGSAMGALLLLAIIGTMLVIALARITSPLAELARVMRDIVDGNRTAAVPGVERSDEVGEMARTILFFRDRLIERDALQSGQERARVVAGERQRHVEGVVGTFRSAVGQSLASVTQQSEQMSFAADSLASIAAQSSRQAQEAAGSMTQASNHVTAVARASEELSASIDEIQRQISRTRSAVSDAARTTSRTSETIDGLVTKADEIGEITGLIQSIAAQTNLLALNATIEAARAGESGRGFAVVAQEVKSLSGQTAKASQRIAEHVGAIQGATAEAVSAIASIGTIMQEAEGFTATIAVAVEQQASATTEISRSVADAARGAEAAAKSVSRLTSAVGETDQSAAHVHAAADDVAREAKRLSATVDQFLTQTVAA